MQDSHYNYWYGAWDHQCRICRVPISTISETLPPSNPITPDNHQLLIALDKLHVIGLSDQDITPELKRQLKIQQVIVQ